MNVNIKFGCVNNLDVPISPYIKINDLVLKHKLKFRAACFKTMFSCGVHLFTHCHSTGTYFMIP